MTEYWFKPKRFGYGATPTNWKGWTSSLALVFAILAIMRFMVVPVRGAPHSLWEVFAGIGIVIALVVGFSWFARIKTEGDWRWRWGKNSK